MPPRKRGRGSKGGAATKRAAVKQEDDGPPPKLQKEESFNSKLKRMIKEESKSSATTKYKPDQILLTCYYKDNPKIHEDYSCMLNQTNIGHNNNKFYVIQLADADGEFCVLTKWGRVGETGAHDVTDFNDLDQAIKQFKKKFTDKTKNKWENRDDFKPVPGKYTMLEMSNESDDEEGEDDVDSKVPTSKVSKTNMPNCRLDARTQLLVKLILSDEMFKNQMTNMNLDVKKMPLGKLSKAQILKGLEALLDIEKATKEKKSKKQLEELSSRFYTVVPHNFGRMVPPVICDQSIIDQKKDLMMTLTDIEIAQSLQKEEVKEEEPLHILDQNYNKLDCKLERVDENSKEFKMLQKFATACKDTRKGKLLDVWKVDRRNEADRFKTHDDIAFRKLLWHGTNVAVVAAILKAGLRIMPHSGGLMGKGIYFASEHAKSSGYVGIHYGKFEGESNVGLMFLAEVALGKMKFEKQCQCQLKAAPKGYDSVVARGQNEPDPKKDVKVTFDDKDVIVPLGTPVPQKEFEYSVFNMSEYLIYKESQARIRYLLKFSFD